MGSRQTVFPSLRRTLSCFYQAVPIARLAEQLAHTVRLAGPLIQQSHEPLPRRHSNDGLTELF